jgi:hypothetical protein
MSNPNQAFFIGAKVGNQHPRAFTLLGVKAEIEKLFSICPKLLMNDGTQGNVWQGKEHHTCKQS